MYKELTEAELKEPEVINNLDKFSSRLSGLTKKYSSASLIGSSSSKIKI